MAHRPIFTRIVLGLPYHRPHQGLNLAAEMATFLQLDLFGLFVEEESLLGLAALPFVRELKLLGGGWRALDVDEISRDLEIAAKSAERAFADAVKNLKTSCQFEVVRGSMAETIASVTRANDIILLIEPASPAERATQQFPAALQAAFHSAAAVLLVPSRIARHSGAIVAIAAKPDDASIDAARAIATAAREELIVIETFKPTGGNHASDMDELTGMRLRRIPVSGGGQDAMSGVRAALLQVRERLVVMTRSNEPSPSSIASLLHVPVLILEPHGDAIETSPASRPGI